MTVRASTTLPADVSTPAVARRFVQEAVAGAPVPVEDVTLVVSELVTNAVVHGAGDVTLRVEGHDEGVLVEVRDARPEPRTLPVPKRADQVSGLLLVSRVARRWGVRHERDGKVVWADLPA